MTLVNVHRDKRKGIGHPVTRHRKHSYQTSALKPGGWSKTRLGRTNEARSDKN